MTDATTSEIARDLARLQKNRGLQAPDVLDKVGLELARVAAVDSAMSHDEARHRLVTALVRAADVLSPDHKLAFLRGCAVRADDFPTLRLRLAAVGEVIKRSPTVTRRRLTEANAAAAQYLVNDAAVRERGWYIGSMNSSVDLREPLPVYRATRTLVVTAPSLDRITERFAFPGAQGAPAPDYSVTGAARVVGVERLPGDIWEFTMALDRVYRRGEHIAYDTALRMPARHHMPPMCVMAPMRDCWHFSARVHFGDCVSQAWVLDGVPVAAAFADTPCGPLVDPVAEPVATREFDALDKGRVYGLRWVWAEAGEPPEPSGTGEPAAR